MKHNIIKEFKNSLGNNPVYLIRGPLSPFLLAFPWSTKNNLLPLFYIIKGRDTLIALDENNYFKIAVDKFSDYWKRKISIKDLKNDYEDLSRSINDFYDYEISKNFNILSEKELVDIMTLAERLFHELAERTLHIETIDYEKVSAVIGKNNNFLEEIWENATHPTFISFEGRRLNDLIEAKDIEKVKYIFTDYFGTKTKEDIENTINDIQKNIFSKKAEVLFFIEDSKRRKEEFEIYRNSRNDDEKRIIDYVQLMMEYRDTRKDLIAKIQAVMCKVGYKMLEISEIPSEYLHYIVVYEYMKGCEYLKQHKSDILVRKNGSMGFIRTDFSFNIEPCNFEDALEEFNSQIVTIETEKEIVGQIANKGKMVGRVKVVLDPNDVKFFEEGDILVTSMTRPEFLHLMKKAGAFVTNEGGITCHAAIVAREMKKPCIIGTKIATKVLKDGDLVEVDAENGVVRVIKHA